MKVKVRDLEDGARGVFSRNLRKKLTGLVQGVSWKRMLLVTFQGGFDNYLTSNQLTVVTV